ncbi:hypothetical protein PBY51_020196 [Eleginops maclovinus]|uniref:Uncharacterized protein n=1 Tax=Eleginops maclovinus TaxID=56733 RepID=A0AAN7XT01_ELEMC|nr:hypothetical protein PBY51_020196 [Eleginops maclovinus]
MLQCHLSPLQSKRQILHQILYRMQSVHQLHHCCLIKMDPSFLQRKDTLAIPLIMRSPTQCRKLSLHHRGEG